MSTRSRLAALTLPALCWLLPTTGPLGAQPYGSWLSFGAGYPTQNTYIEIPHSAALNTPGSFTFEAWVAVTNTTVDDDCRSIAGKNYKSAWWFGFCNIDGYPTLRSFVKGESSSAIGGVLTRGAWQHVALVYDKGAGKRRHYLNGQLVHEVAETGALPTNTAALRLAGDVSWPHSPGGSLDEARLWKVARTEDQLREFLNRHITAPKPTGLAAQWSLDGNGNDTFNRRNGTVVNGAFLTFPAGPPCVSGPPSGNTACLLDRFQVSASFRNLANGQYLAASVGATNGDAAVFALLLPENWSVLVRALDACGLTPNRYWIFASTLSEWTQVTVFDTKALQQKIYFIDWQLPPRIDLSAFATCP